MSARLGIALTLDAWTRHRDRDNLHFHAVSGLLAWIALTVALSRVPAPVSLPLLGANAGAWLTLSAVLFWLPLDGIVAVAVGALTVAVATVGPWGPGTPLVVTLAAVGLVAAAAIAQRYAHIHWHEHAPFLAGESRSRRLANEALALAFGPFVFGVLALLERGWRPALRARYVAAERAAHLRRVGGPWRNWAGTAACAPAAIRVPQTREDLVAVVREARREGRRIRVVGSGFSWSGMVPTDDVLVFCERLDGVEVDTSDPARPAVWAEAGVTNRTLNRALAAKGLAMPWNVVLENVRIAGIVSAGTHGSGRNTGTMGDLVEAVEVVDSAGEVRVLSEATIGREAMRAVRLGLGMFGVILRVRLRVIAAHRVRQVDRTVPVGETLARIAELVATHDSVELYWFAFNDELWLRTFDRTDEPTQGGGHGVLFSALNLVQNTFFVLSAPTVQALARRAVPAFQRFAFRRLTFRTRVLSLTGALHYRKWIEMVRCGCVEVGFRMDPEGDTVRRAFAAAEEIVARYAARGLYPMNLTLNVRFVGPSDALLSPAYGPTGLTCYIEALCVERPEGWAAFSADLVAAWMELPGALPHWAKEFEHVPGIMEQTCAHLGERRARFRDALRAVDPGAEAAFANPMLRRLLSQPEPEAMVRSGHGG